MFVILLDLVVCIGIGTASDTPAEKVADSNQTDSSIDLDASLSAIEFDMRSGDFDQRQQAMMRLWADHKAYRTWVENAVHDPDIEVSRRATWVLDRWRRGLLRDTPREISSRLEGGQGPEAIENLLNAGLFQAALVALDELLSDAKSPAVVDRAESAIRRRFPFYIRLANENDDMPALVSILNRLANDAAMCRAFSQLRMLTSDDEHEGQLGEATRLSESDKRKYAIVLQVASGEITKATTLAESFNDPELLRVCRMLGGDWQILAREQLAAARSQPPGSVEWYRHWMYALVASSRCDDEEIRHDAISELSKPRGNENVMDALPKTAGEEKDIERTDPVDRIRWQTLAIHGEMDAAIRILKLRQSMDAAELLAQASRFPEAFEALGVDWTALDSEMNELVDDAVSAERNSLGFGNQKASDELKRLLAVVRLLISTGRDDLALQSLRSFVSHPSLRSQEEAGMIRMEIVRVLWRVSRTEWIDEFLVGESDKTLPGQTQFMLSMIFGAEVESIGSLVDAMGQFNATLTFAQRVRDTVSILGGTLPHWFDPNTDFNRLYDSVLNSNKVTRDVGGGVRLENASSLSIDIARLFGLHGQTELAERTLTELSSSGDIEATLQLAESELNGGNIAVARTMFRSIWNSVEEAGQNITRLNQADSDALIAMKAIDGEAIAATRLGDVEGAIELRRQIAMMVCTPSATLLNSYAEYLTEQGMNDQAKEILEPLMALAAFGLSDGVEFYTVAHNYDSAVAATMPDKAAAALDLAIAGTTDSTSFYPAAYISVPSLMYRRKIRAAIDKRDEPETRKQVEKLLQLDPIDIDFGEKVLGAMRDVGMGDLANEILERMYQTGNKHLKDFPLDVAMSNNLAWVLSLSDYRLDDALRMSKNAVFYEPDSTIYRDTLAEVLFRLKRNREAIEIEKACLLDDPAEWHVHEQIQRFESAKSP